MGKYKIISILLRFIVAFRLKHIILVKNKKYPNKLKKLRFQGIECRLLLNIFVKKKNNDLRWILRFFSFYFRAFSKVKNIMFQKKILIEVTIAIGYPKSNSVANFDIRNWLPGTLFWVTVLYYVSCPYHYSSTINQHQNP